MPTAQTLSAGMMGGVGGMVNIGGQVINLGGIQGLGAVRPGGMIQPLQVQVSIGHRSTEVSMVYT